MNKKSWVVSLVTTATLLMACVKMEDSVAQKAYGSGADLGPTRNNAYKQVQIVMKSVYMVYKVLFQSLLEAVGHSCEDINVRVHTEIRNPPYITRPIA